MPTYGRPDYVDEAVAMFVQQDYPAKELVILNDCPGQVFHSDRADVRVFNYNTRFPTLGEKRNVSIDLAEGELIAIWDDDDAYLPWRLSFSYAELSRLQTPFYRPDRFLVYYGQADLRGAVCAPDGISHSTVLFRKDLWKDTGGYPALNLSEDMIFFERIHARLGETFLAYTIHPIDRYYILRAKSHYRHACIAGGHFPLDIAPGDFPIQPRPIDDPVLRRAFQKHSEARH
jgi:glycosyltransferase involved in cell wall biosynthesis